ncbi:hypothetical protein KUV64_14955 [Mameliella alba]|uniref:hypothetical protein n=1 Tax=Mameliella TaxID=1434019 RepID=UPI001C9701C9|nr:MULTISPECIES: hypothetical protein [Mameliella]MBY6120431.1 hypothetical protein [Mameliella alba]MDD9730874.1 hypothetical protein [Mameliella sp. AT18]
MSDTPDPTWMIEVLRDLRAFAEYNSYPASVEALKEAEKLIENEVGPPCDPNSDFPK